jgi:hypothetical protein
LIPGGGTERVVAKGVEPGCPTKNPPDRPRSEESRAIVHEEHTLTDG